MHHAQEKHQGHHEEPSHEHEAAKMADAPLEKAKLLKMVEHWIGHNEDHARSYRLWANRARDAGYLEPGGLLEEIASEIIRQNEKLMRITQIIDSSK